MRKKSIKIISFNYILLAVVFVLLFSSCSNIKTNNPQVFSGLYFDTFISITIYDKCPDNINTLLSDKCKYYDKLFSLDNPDSIIYKINHSKNQPINCPDEFIYVLNEAINYAKISDGKLDPTMESVSKLWDYNSDSPSIPNAELINNALKTVDYKNITISNNMVSVNNNARINLGYIAKGYIADSLVSFLKESNINNVIINLGGNIITSGHKQNNDSFTLGIEKPFSPNEVIYSLKTTNSSLVTSGIYERYIEYNNKIYHHILSTENGYPVNNHVYSVTISGPSSMQCDILSTWLFIEGAEKGMSIIKKYEGYEALYIMDDYSIIKSDNFPD